MDFSSDIRSALTGEGLELFLMLMPVLILSMVIHELAHAYVANRLGDPTAKMMGRLTPNPIVHIDPMGSIMFAATWILSGGQFLFGWAKPIPVQPRFFNHPQRGFAIVAIAGPISNILIAYIVALVGLNLSVSSDLISELIVLAFTMNILLAVFNMLPIPPLDGSRVIAAFMPRDMAEAWSGLDRYGFMILFALIFIFRGPMFEIINSIRRPIESVLITLAGG